MNERSARRRSVHSAGAGREAFTLIELLVVIAIIALLVAILVPTLRRVRNQGRAVVCQSNLKQWGLHFAMYASENDGRSSGIARTTRPAIGPRPAASSPGTGLSGCGTSRTIKRPWRKLIEFSLPLGHDVVTPAEAGVQ